MVTQVPDRGNEWLVYNTPNENMYVLQTSSIVSFRGVPHCDR